MISPKVAVLASEVPARTVRSIYPQPFAAMMAGREKQVLGDLFGIKNFGVNLTRLAPGAKSALLHHHSLQEEFIFILQGQPTLVTESEEIQLQEGMCAGFTPTGSAHQLINRTDHDVLFLEVGDRSIGDEVTYPADDLVASFSPEGKWVFSHKNGEPY